MTVNTAARWNNAITQQQREQFESQGFLVVRNALDQAEVARLTEAVDRLYAQEERAGRLDADGNMHLLGCLLRDEAFLDLLDHPATFPVVWGILGWNIFGFHSHADVRPPLPGPRPRRWRWHQDGTRINLEVETPVTRPRLSVKCSYWLSDASQPGRGNFSVIPGSHRSNTLRRPRNLEDYDEEPPGAVELTAEPGDAIVFDRRIWHARTDNHSRVTRKAVFVAYTYRWMRPYDYSEVPAELMERLSPVRRQLLGEGADPLNYWGRGDAGHPPLFHELNGAGMLDPSVPNQRP